METESDRTLHSALRMLVSSAALLWATMPSVHASSEPPIVIGMSVSNAIADGRAFNVQAGFKAYLDRINASGGVNGRMIDLVTMNDDGLPEHYASNLRTLVNENKSIAIVGCLGDTACPVAASVASELKVPLIGVLSGVTTLSRHENPYVFRVRADYTKEVDAMANQMLQLGHSMVAIMSDGSIDHELDDLLIAAMSRRSIRSQLIRINPAKPETLTEAVQQLGGKFQAVVMNVSASTSEALIDRGISNRPEWPRTLLALSATNLAALSSDFKGQVIGFSMVVPIPDRLVTRLSRELDQDATKYGSPRALTLAGMEAYISARLLVEALKASGRNVTSERLLQTLATTDDWDIRGFHLSFRRARSTGSDWVEIGLRSRDGMLVN